MFISKKDLEKLDTKFTKLIEELNTQINTLKLDYQKEVTTRQKIKKVVE